MKLLENTTICLRPLEPEDLELLYKWENDASLWTLGGTVSPYSYYILKEYIAESYKDIYEQKQQRLMITLNESGKTIGMIDLYDFDPHNSRAGVGILIDTDFQGKGYAGQAVKLIIDYSFSFLKLHQLYVHIPTDNITSKKLFTSCGFKESGIVKDWNSVSEGFSDVCIMQLINS
ncbi:GNAT family N-acetyltransferase [Massilibacteroides sp.]|uniref:GNAT family N-acetyltransferase n=1 Tax=Massilibacteroides sp. TaxID=2034766 RepID=UPI00260DBBBB|nr:GNAT family N-acetyltransferase [Massilibacteroides sp.]MDD4516628.1 GNAT family N-acetyltransferase [Massilibacteroides sp.]